jgi:hypothetical protein
MGSEGQIDGNWRLLAGAIVHYRPMTMTVGLRMASSTILTGDPYFARHYGRDYGHCEL